MARPRIRVLIDLSMACRGYCGIAQDTRLLYKTLALCPELDVTGLIYPPQKLAARHRFLSRRASRADRLANQSEFLWKLAAGGLDWKASSPWKNPRHLPRLAATVLGFGAQCDPLEAGAFEDALWRLLFQQTLSPDDKALVAEGPHLLANVSDGMVYARALSGRRPIKLDTRGYDFLIVQGPRPFRIHRDTRHIVRYHDMIPVLDPDTMANPWVIAWHHRAIRQSRRAHFVCNSEPTRDSLTSVYPELNARSTAIPYMLADAYRPQPDPGLLRSIISLRRSKATSDAPPRLPKQPPRYLMCVSTLEPRKNFGGLIQAFQRLRSFASVRQRVGDLKLVIVGSPGWKYEPILAAMRQPASEGSLIHLQGVSTDEMRVLYTHAEAFVFPSHAEGFGFPPLEAMQCHTPVVASDLPAHRWVMGDAALYCNPYEPAAICSAVERLVASDESSALRATLVARGLQRVARYSIDKCQGQWLELLEQLHGQEAASSHQSACVDGPRPLRHVA